MNKRPGLGGQFQRAASNAPHVNSYYEGWDPSWDSEHQSWHSWSVEFGFEREHYDGTPQSRHGNAIDAFRHGYVSGNTFGSFPAGVGEFLCDLYTDITERSNSGHDNMDRNNNKLGLSVYRELERKLGRQPTKEEFAEQIAKEIVDGKFVTIKDNAPPGWKQRIADELSARDLRDYFERNPGPSRGDALAPDGHDRFDRDRMDFDRFHDLPGLGDGETMIA